MTTKRLYVAAALVASFFATALHLGPALSRADIFEDDAAHHVFWLYRYADPALFPGDITVDYLRTSAPVGYRAVYAGAAQLMDVAYASKLLAVALLLSSFWLAWKVASSIAGPDNDLRGLLGVASLIAMLALNPKADLIGVMALQRFFSFAANAIVPLGANHETLRMGRRNVASRGPFLSRAVTHARSDGGRCISARRRA